MNRRKIYSTIITGLLLVTLAVTAATIQAQPLRSVYGDVYVDNELVSSGINVKIIFSNENEYNDTTDSNGAYVMNFQESNYEEGEFWVYYNYTWYKPTDNQTIELGGEHDWDYPIDLHVSTSPDTENPSKVTGLTVTDNKDGKLGLSWNAATDNIDVDHYCIYRGGAFLINETTTSYQDAGLTNGQLYTYEVSAVDTSENEGEKSDSASGTPTASSSGGDGDGDGGGGLPPPSNQPPVADASESQTFGYVDESIVFDGSKSDDTDGTIDLYEWDWDNDGVYDYNSTSSATTHTFNEAGTYSVTLRVTDNEGATDKDTIEVVISKANLQPTKPTIDGTSEGTKDTEYTYIFQSTDPDNDTIQYIINWGDGEVTETEFLPSGTASTQIHSWMSAGKYTLTVRASDNETVSSTNQTTVLIDVHLVDDIGYLIDDDADGTYDSFHNDTSGQETDVEKQNDGTYLLDDDGDDSWDWIYDIETDTLTEYSEPTPEPDNSALIVLAIIVILFLIILGYLVKRSNDKKKAQKKAAEKKSQPKKKTTSKKSKK